MHKKKLFSADMRTDHWLLVVSVQSSIEHLHTLTNAVSTIICHVIYTFLSFLIQRTIYLIFIQIFVYTGFSPTFVLNVEKIV